MQYGDIGAIKWVLKNIEREYVIDYLERKGETALDRRSYLFWKKLGSYNDLWK